jgi:hypothetical protein
MVLSAWAEMPCSVELHVSSLSSGGGSTVWRSLAARDIFVLECFWGVLWLLGLDILNTPIEALVRSIKAALVRSIGEKHQGCIGEKHWREAMGRVKTHRVEAWAEIMTRNIEQKHW